MVHHAGVDDSYCVRKVDVIIQIDRNDLHLAPKERRPYDGTRSADGATAGDEHGLAYPKAALCQIEYGDSQRLVMMATLGSMLGRKPYTLRLETFTYLT